MLPIKSIVFDKIDKSNWRIDKYPDYSQQIRVSIFIDIRYNRLILLIVEECCRLSTLWHAHHVSTPGAIFGLARLFVTLDYPWAERETVRSLSKACDYDIFSPLTYNRSNEITSFTENHVLLISSLYSFFVRAQIQTPSWSLQRLVSSPM